MKVAELVVSRRHRHSIGPVDDDDDDMRGALSVTRRTQGRRDDDSNTYRTVMLVCDGDKCPYRPVIDNGWLTLDTA